MSLQHFASAAVRIARYVKRHTHLRGTFRPVAQQGARDFPRASVTEHPRKENTVTLSNILDESMHTTDSDCAR